MAQDDHRALVKSVDRYMARTFLAFLAGVLGVLTAALQLLDLVGRSDDILVGSGGDWTAIGRYVRLRAPAIAAQFAAPAALIAAMGAFASLNRSSELIILRAVGVSPGRMMRPLIQAGAILALLHFVAVDRVIAPDRAKLDAWETTAFGALSQAETPKPAPIWIADRDAYVKVGAFARHADGFTISDVTIYERDAAGQLEARMEAASGAFRDGGWTLHDVDRFEGDTMVVRHLDIVEWATSVSPAQFLNAVVSTDELSAATLIRYIEQLERQGVKATDLRTDLFHRLSASLALALMPVLGAVVAFGAPRRNPLLLRASAGMGLGFIYFVMENVMVALGRVGAASPALAAFTPLIVFSVIGAAVLLYGDEHVAKPSRRRRRILETAQEA